MWANKQSGTFIVSAQYGVDHIADRSLTTGTGYMY